MKTKRRVWLPILISIVLLGSLSWGLWTWYDANVDRSGWQEAEDGTRFYQDFYGDPVSGWLDIEGQRYYFEEGGVARTGWQTIGGSRYYFREDGAMARGWMALGGKHYFFMNSGVMAEGWLSAEEGKYYLQEGVRLTGWQEIEGNRYYFGPEGLLSLGFAKVDGATYYFGENGVLATGIQTINERIFCFGEDGAMRTGWEESGDGWRYYYEDGPMARGWTQLEGDTYFFQEDGLMVTGWQQDGEYRRYFQGNGAMAVGPTEIGGRTYYFSPKGIEIVLVNALNPVPEDYQLDPVNVVDRFDVDRRCYDALMKMLGDCENAGIEYIFNSGYRSLKEQTEILELRTAEHMQEFGLTYGAARAKALQTVALPGTSEHHLGLAVDILGKKAIAWLQEHCWEYGFIVRYTGEKYPVTGIIEEPWHFRYVGLEVAQDIKASGLCLEEYLGAEAVKPEAAAEPTEAEEAVYDEGASGETWEAVG